MKKMKCCNMTTVDYFTYGGMGESLGVFITVVQGHHNKHCNTYICNLLLFYWLMYIPLTIMPTCLAIVEIGTATVSHR
jgi:hypothetical protein